MELPRGIYLLYHLTGGPNAHIHCDSLSKIKCSNHRNIVRLVVRLTLG